MFQIVMTTTSGDRVVLDRARRVSTARGLLKGHVNSKHAQFVDHSRPCERVLTGEVPVVGDEVLASVVIAVFHEGDAMVRFAMESVL